MQVLLVNGSPHQHGCTFTALDEVRKTLEEEGIGTQMYWVGTKPIAGCIDCRRCGTLKKCVFNDKVNEFLGMAADFDGFFFGTPVHWAASGGRCPDPRGPPFWPRTRRHRRQTRRPDRF